MKKKTVKKTQKTPYEKQQKTQWNNKHTSCSQYKIQNSQSNSRNQLTKQNILKFLKQYYRIN